MKILTCPMNGTRNINEFQNFGPLRNNLDPEVVSDQEWSRHLFRANNACGILQEWWRHEPSNYFFVAERNIVTNEVIRTFDPSELESLE